MQFDMDNKVDIRTEYLHQSINLDIDTRLSRYQVSSKALSISHRASNFSLIYSEGRWLRPTQRYQ
jgi:hypothetical protein